jgi:hypothetical protein
MEMSMSYQPSHESFPSDAVSLHEKMLRLRQQIVEAQQYRRTLDGEAGATVSASSLKMEKQIADLRISEMESRLTGLLDWYAD